MTTYINKGTNQYVVYGSRDFRRDADGNWLHLWPSTSVWFVPGTYQED